MPLKSGKSKFRYHFGKLRMPYSIFPISPVYFVVAIGAQGLKIFEGIVCSIFVFMVDTKNADIFNATFFATYFAKFFNGICKPIWDIGFFGLESPVGKIRTRARAKPFLPALESYSAGNDVAAQLTGMALNAS